MRRWEVANVRLVAAQLAAPALELPARRVARGARALRAAPNEAAAEAARLRDMHPSDVAGVVRALPLSQRRQLAAAMDDDRLADLLEELPEEEQLRLIEGLDLDRVVDVLDEMEYDDLADLLHEMPGEQRTAILEAMDDEEAEVVSRLLSLRGGHGGRHDDARASSSSVPTTTVAEALAQIRDPDWTPSIASQVFVCQAPIRRPPARFLGVVFIAAAAPRATEHGAVAVHRAGARASRPNTPDREVSRGSASYNMLALPRARRGRPAARRDERRRRARPDARSGWRQRVSAGGVTPLDRRCRR